MTHYAMIPMDEYEEYIRWKQSKTQYTPPTYKNTNDDMNTPF